MKKLLLAIMLFSAVSVSAQCYFVMNTDTNELSRIKIDSKSYTVVTEYGKYVYPITQVTNLDIEEDGPVMNYSSTGEQLHAVFVWQSNILELISDDGNNYYILLYLDSIDMPVRVWQEKKGCRYNVTHAYREGCAGLDELFGDTSESNIYYTVYNSRIFIPRGKREDANASSVIRVYEQKNR